MHSEVQEHNIVHVFSWVGDIGIMAGFQELILYIL